MCEHLRAEKRGVYTNFSIHIGTSKALVKLRDTYVHPISSNTITNVLNMFETIVQSGENFSGFSSVTASLQNTWLIRFNSHFGQIFANSANFVSAKRHCFLHVYV